MDVTFTLDQGHLFSLLSSMQPICSKRTALEVTECILFEIAPRELILKATDLEIALQMSMPIESSLTETVKFVVSGKRVCEVVKELDGALEFVVTDRLLKISANKSIGLSLTIKDATDFPPFPERIENFMQVSSGFLAEILSKASFLIPQNNANAALNGLLVECGPEGLSLVATDGHSLVRVNSKKYTLAEARKWLLPKRAVLELKKLLDMDVNTMVFWGVCGSQLVFSGNQFNFFTRLINDNFPQYQAVLNKDGFRPAHVTKEPFVKTLKRAGCLLAGQFVSTAFTFKPGHLDVHLDNKEVGSLEEGLLLNDYDGDAVQSRYYSPYLLNGLQVIDDKEVAFFIKNEMRPLILESRREDYDLTYLVMPVSNNASRA